MIILNRTRVPLQLDQIQTRERYDDNVREPIYDELQKIYFIMMKSRKCSSEQRGEPEIIFNSQSENESKPIQVV